MTPPNEVQGHILQALKWMFPDLGKDRECVVELCATGCHGYSNNWEGLCGGKEGLVVGWYDDPRKLAAQAAALDEGWFDNRSDNVRHPSGIYVTANNVNSALLGRANNRLVPGASRTTDRDIKRYTNLYIDIDAGVPSGVSSNNAEKDQAIVVMKGLRDYLTNHQFWPQPLVADSGNGAHLIFRADFTADKINTGIYKDFLNLLGQKFNISTTDQDTGRDISTKIDTTVHNPARLVKLYGTMARKGDATAARPHRRSQTRYMPKGEPDPITAPMLQGAVNMLKDELGVDAENEFAPPAPGKRQRYSRPNRDKMFTAIDGVEPLHQGGLLKVDEYLAAYSVEIKSIKELPGGGRLYILDRCVFDSSHRGGEAAVGQQPDGKLFYQCYHNSCSDRVWADARKAISGEDRLGSFKEGGISGIEFPFLVGSGPKKGQPYARVENFVALLNAYGIKLRFNDMTRKIEYDLPKGMVKSRDKVATLAGDICGELCVKHGLGGSRMDNWMRIVADNHLYHPIKDWIRSRDWDGVSRFEALLNTVKVPRGQEKLKRIYLHKWLLQGVAALYKEDFCSRGVLTFTGPQQIGKTTWFKNLVPKELKAFGEGLHLDPGDKDSLTIVLSKWLVELGEVDSVFAKTDVGKLKAFLTKDGDELRVPYGRENDQWRRQTFFGATVNNPQFLQDDTGNTRWWVLKVESFQFDHGIDVQQLWAEYEFKLNVEGRDWFLDADEQELSNISNKQFEAVDPVRERILAAYDFSILRAAWMNKQRVADVMDVLGINDNRKGTANQIGTALRDLCGDFQILRVNGIFGKWYDMPPRNMFKHIQTDGKAEIIPFKQKSKDESK